jgi:hypothetical protein
MALQKPGAAATREPSGSERRAVWALIRHLRERWVPPVVPDVLGCMRDVKWMDAHSGMFASARLRFGRPSYRCGRCGHRVAEGVKCLYFHDGDFSVEYRACAGAFIEDVRAAYCRSELYLTLRAGHGDAGSPLSRLPRDLMRLLWVWCVSGPGP